MWPLHVAWVSSQLGSGEHPKREERAKIKSYHLLWPSLEVTGHQFCCFLLVIAVTKFYPDSREGNIDPYLSIEVCQHQFVNTVGGVGYMLVWLFGICHGLMGGAYYRDIHIKKEQLEPWGWSLCHAVNQLLPSPGMKNLNQRFFLLKDTRHRLGLTRNRKIDCQIYYLKGRTLEDSLVKEFST